MGILERVDLGGVGRARGEAAFCLVRCCHGVEIHFLATSGVALNLGRLISGLYGSYLPLVWWFNSKL